MNSRANQQQSVTVESSAAEIAANDRSPYLFVVGCPRSGTTLLQRMLNHHPLLAVANDTHFIPRAIEKNRPELIDDLVQGRAVSLDAELVHGVREYHRFARLGLEDSDVDLAASDAVTYQDLVRRLYTAFGKRQGKPVTGEKTPDYVRHLPLLHGMFPAARTIHIIRDGRDVALSLLDWATEKKGPGRLELWKEQPVAVSALWWRWQVQSGRRARGVLGQECCLEVHYEDLVDRSDDLLRQMTDFLKLPFSAEMVAFHEGRSRPDSGLSAKQAWLPPTSGLRCWKTDMDREDIALFELLAGDLLTDLGYPTSGLSPSPETKAVAVQAQEWWDTTMSRRSARAERRLDLFAAARQRVHEQQVTGQ